MNATCPSDLALETYLLEPASSPVSTHLDKCAACAARLARMKAEGDEFRQFVFPATVEAVERAAEKRSRKWFRWPVLIAPLAAATAMAVMVLNIRPEPEGFQTKGGGLGFAVYVNGSAGASAAEEGEKVPAAAALRFTVAPEGDCYLWILSVDAKGEVSRLYPPAGRDVDVRRNGAVPGGALLDGQPGPERIFAACAPDARTSWNEIRAAAAPAAGGAERVRAAHSLGGALKNAKQATVLLEKQP